MVTLSLFCKGSECSIPSATYWESWSKGQLSLSFPTYNEGLCGKEAEISFFILNARYPGSSQHWPAGIRTSRLPHLLPH